MRLDEFDQELDEGIRSWLAAAGIAVASLASLNAILDYVADQDPSVRNQVRGIVQNKEVDAAAELLRTALNPMEKQLIRAAQAAGINGVELKQFLAQCSHETMDFKFLKELGSDRYIARKYDRKFAPAKAKALGNVNIGDGVRYKGRGFIQLTGRYNYKRAGEALGLPLEAKPELVERPDIAAKVAVWFWKQRVQPRVDDFTDTPASTRPINPGLKGLDDREAKFQGYRDRLTQATKTAGTKS
jgi:predicted chitinase